jgi:hypothetical protein
VPFSAADRYGTIGTWIASANTGQAADAGFTQATQLLHEYGAALAQLSAEEAARVKTRYGLLELTDASVVHGLEALGFLRGHAPRLEVAVRALEDDTFSSDLDYNTQVAVLNKINATGVTAARLAKDTNNLLVSLLEQQLVDATARREAAVQAVNAHIAFESEARDLLQRTTAHTTDALTTFRIP